MKRLNTEDFINRAKLIHKNKYDYSDVVYTGMRNKVIIKCNFCNLKFEQIANDHLAGCDCSWCTGKLFDLNCFINKANKMHGFLYDYTKSVYVNTDTKINILCNTCNYFFEQTPHDHLGGHGCQRCAQCYQKSYEEFVEKANKIHNYKYDYTQSLYKNNSSHILIICKKCNLNFNQTPHHHLIGQGCFDCASKRSYSISKPETEWLDSLNIAVNFRNRSVFINNKRYNVDAIINNNIYEFYGDYWHGNLKIYNKDNLNKRANKTFGELFINTVARENELKNAGYNVIYIWESDWKNLVLIN